MPRLALLATLLVATGFAGCDLLGESPEKLAAAREAEGRAIGSACRQADRALEDCFTLNKKADKASVFAGWRDMNDYMRENKMEAVTPQLTPPAGANRGEAKGEAKDSAKEGTDDAKAESDGGTKAEVAADGESADKHSGGAKPRAGKHADS